MSKQPYIPLYLGDWTQDTDGLTIEAEGAWLRVIFKCWRNSGDFTATVEILARICKVDCSKFASILLEWKMNNICDVIEHDNVLITLTSRRMKTDIAKSAVKALSGSKGGKVAQAKIKQNENSAKANSDIDNDIVIDTDNSIELKLKESLNEIYIDQQRPKWAHIDFDFELNSFLEKVRGSPDDYLTRDNSGIKLAFQYQLRNAKPKGKNGKSTDKGTEHANSLLEGYKRRHGSPTG
jgi:uncharacterized protein YdaU (DUF1376 family)